MQQSEQRIPVHHSSRLTYPTASGDYYQQSSTTNECLAYFLYRIDIDDYKSRTLTQTVETVLARTKSRGLKVRISLQDEGIVIRNLNDANQSWLFKTSELSEYWIDPYSNDICIIITLNRSRQALMPYSASVFRLRGKDYTYFIQETRQYFNHITSGKKTWKSSSTHHHNKNSSSAIRIKYSPLETTSTMSHQNMPIEKPSRVENWPNDKDYSSNKKTSRHDSRSKHRSNNEHSRATTTPKRSTLTILSKPEISDEQQKVVNKPTYNNGLSASKPNTIRLVTRSEFDTGVTTTKTTEPEPQTNTSYDSRTYSESAVSSSESQATSKDTTVTKTTTDNDTEDTVSSTLPGVYVSELIKELKELRVELAALKTDANLKSNNGRETPRLERRSMSTSPLSRSSNQQEEIVSPQSDDVATMLTTQKHSVQSLQNSENESPTATTTLLENLPQPPPLPPRLDESALVTSVQKRRHIRKDRKSSKRKPKKRNRSASSTTSVTATISDAEETVMERGTHMNDTQLPPIIYSYNNSANYSPQFDGTSINSSSNDRNDPAMLRIIREEELLAKVPYVIENEMIKLFQGNTDNNGITVTSKSYPFRESKRYGDKIHQLTETTNKEPIYENVGPTFENNDYVNMPLSTSTNDYTQGDGYYYYTIDSNTNSNQIPQKPRKTRKSKSHQHQVVNVQQNGIDNTQTFTQKQLEQYFVQQQQLSSSSNFDPQSQQYVTQLLQQNGYILQPMSSDAWTALFNPSNQIQHQQQQQQQQQQQNDIAVNENSVEVTPATTNRSSRSHRGQPVYFADRLTNPAFSVDKELLTNTIANQFGYDINSPQLQQLVQNQHLFAARRRTFANMVWQLTPDEELALLSSSSSSTNHLSQNDSDTTTTNQNNNNNQMNGSNGNGKSILKKEYIKNKPPIIPSTNTTAYNKRKNVSFTNPTFYVS